MVLEFLLGFEQRKPLHLFATGMFFSSISVFISASLFAHAPSMVVVTFMTLPLVYIWTGILGKRSVHESGPDTFAHLWKDNIGIAEDFLALFLGMAVGIAVWFAVLPQEMLANMFTEQLWNLNAIGMVTGFAQSPPTGLEVAQVTGMAINPDVFITIAVNNIKLVLLSALLSFVFAAGAFFILAWNASVVGVAVGTMINKFRVAGVFVPLALGQGLGLGIVFYILHLVPEVVAYFYASVAGAFISNALLRYKPFSRHSNRLLAISGGLIAVAVGLILLGAVIEVGISHQIQSALHV